MNFHSTAQRLSPPETNPPLFSNVPAAPSASLSALHNPIIPPFSLGQLYMAWEALKQRGGLYLIYGDVYATDLAQKLLARPLFSQTPVILLDGNNSFNLYLYTRLAKHFARSPEQFLRLIKISRAFTCHQMVSLAERTRQAAEKYHAALVVALAPLATFYDENVPLFETNKLFKQFHGILRDLANSGLKVLLACPEAPIKQRSQYLDALKRGAAFRLACERHSTTELGLRLERPEAFQQTWTLTSPSVIPLRRWQQPTLFH